MAYPLKTKFRRSSKLAIKVKTSFPGRIVGGDGITVDKSGGVWTISSDFVPGEGTWTGDVIAAIYGGTGQSSYTTGDMLYADSTTTLAKLNASTSGYALMANGAGVAPSYQGFLQSGTGAVTRTWLSKAKDDFSVKDFGAAGDGVADDNAEVAAAVAAAALVQGRVVKPPGTYNVTANPTGAMLIGDGRLVRSGTDLADVFSIISSMPTTPDDENDYFGGDHSKVWPAEQFIIGAAVPRASLTSNYFQPVLIPHFGKMNVDAGSSGTHAWLTATATAGTNTLTVNSTAGLTNGQTIRLEPGAGAQEDVIILSGGGGGTSLTLTANLTQNHTVTPGGPFPEVQLSKRTSSSYHFTEIQNSVGGDVYGHVIRINSNSYSLNAGQGHFFFGATSGALGIEVNLTGAGAYGQFTEGLLQDNGVDAAGLGWVSNYNRTVATGAKGVVWGHDFANSYNQRLEWGYNLLGGYKRFIDFSRATLDSDNAAISLPNDARIYYGATATKDVGGFSFYGNVLSDTYYGASDGASGYHRFVLQNTTMFNVDVNGLTTLKSTAITNPQLRLEQSNATDGWNLLASGSDGGLKFSRAGSGAIANALILAQTTGAATFIAGVTATSFNGNTITTGTGTLTLAAGKTFTVSNTLTVTATDGSTAAFGAGGTVAYVANKLSVFAATTSAELAGVISDETGSGALVFANTPTLVTPVLGVASATSINKVAITAPATNATLTIPDGVTLTGPAASGTAMTLGNTETVIGVKTFGSAGAVGRLKIAGTTSGTITLDATATAGSNTLTLPAETATLITAATTKTLTNTTYDTAGSGNNFSINGVAATANTGTGAVARASSPTFITPTLGAASATTLNGNTFTTGTYILTGASGKTFTFSNSLTLTGTDSTSFAFPSTSGTVATLNTANVFSVGQRTTQLGIGTAANSTYIFDVASSGQLLLRMTGGTGSGQGAGFFVTDSAPTTIGFFGSYRCWQGAGTSNDFVLASYGALKVVIGTNGGDRIQVDDTGVNLVNSVVYKVAGNQVVGPRDTGWTAMTGSPDESTAYATGSVTLPQLAGRVAALQAALTTHGLIGA